MGKHMRNMMRMGMQSGLSAAGMFLLIASATAQAAAVDAAARAKMTVSEVRACMAKNLAYRGALRDLKVEVTDREGKTRALKMKLFWKPTKAGAARMNLRVLEPADLKGSSYLMLDSDQGEEVYFYLPASKQVQKISGQMMAQPLWGTDFSYGEIKQVHGVLETGNAARKADAKVGGRSVFVLEAMTQPEKTGYSKILSYVDQDTCVLLKSEFFGKNGKAAKIMEGDLATLFTLDEYSVMLNYTMRDLRKKTKTLLTMSDLNLLEGSREALFSPAAFYKEDSE